MIVYWIDPQGWRGWIPMNINLATVVFACSLGTSTSYLIASGMVSTLGKISGELNLKIEKGDRIRAFAVNTKHTGDLLSIVLLIALPKYTWLIYGIFHAYTAIVYMTLNAVAVYCGRMLANEMDRISANVNGNSLGDATGKLRRYVRDTIVSELVLRPLGIATIIWWIQGEYSPDNYYNAPSFGMNLFINFSGVLDSLMMLVTLNLYISLGFGTKSIPSAKDSFFMTLLSKVFVSNNKTISSGSNAITSGASVGQTV